jgi:hypothetical protein
LPLVDPPLAVRLTALFSSYREEVGEALEEEYASVLLPMLLLYSVIEYPLPISMLPLRAISPARAEAVLSQFAPRMKLKLGEDGDVTNSPPLFLLPGVSAMLLLLFSLVRGGVELPV